MQRQIKIWGKHEGKLNQLFELQSGNCSIQLRHFAGGWEVANEKLKEPVAATGLQISEMKEKLGNSNIYFTGRSANMYIQPALPPKAIVFRNSSKILIRPHQSMRIFLAVPIYIQLYYSQVNPEHLLTEFETHRLTDTWFGEPDFGIPSFSVGSRYAMQADELEVSHNEVIVPVNIYNNSTQLLDVQRLLVRVELMNLYKVGDRFISDMGTVEFKGPGQFSHLNFSTEKNIHGANPQAISKARQAWNRNILGHSFHFIKQMTHFSS